MEKKINRLDEQARLEKLASYHILDTEAELIFDDITYIASKIFKMPISLISFTDKDRQWFKSTVGFNVSEIPRSISFCSDVINTDEILYIPDASKDKNFSKNPLVLGDPHIRFYAGAPIITPDGFRLGAICIIDNKPRELNLEQKEILRRLSRQVAQSLELRVSKKLIEYQAHLLRSIIDNTKASIFIKKMPEGKYLLVNKNFQKLLNCSASEAFGKTDDQILPKEIADIFKAADWEIFNVREERVFEDNFPDSEGNISTYLTSRFPIYDVEGNFYAVGGVATDITKLKDTQFRLEEINEELQQFSYRTSHDLKAPLVTVRGLANAIVEDVSDNDFEEASRNAYKIGKHIEKLENVVVDILNLAKADLEATKDTSIDLNEVLQDIEMKLEKIKNDNDVEIIKNIDGSIPVCTSKARLTQVLENLISNSIKYFDSKKENNFVKISIRDNNNKITIIVSDNGLGIPQLVRERVFKMFERFHPDVALGSGLGMYIIKKHILKMNGEIRFLTSDNGTSFYIDLPKV